MSRTIYRVVSPEAVDESARSSSGGDGGSSYQQSTGDGSDAGLGSLNHDGAEKSGSRLSATLAEVPNIFAAFGLWAPVYITGFTLSCFLLAFVISRPPACDQSLHHFLYVSSAVLFVSMLAFAARDVWEQRRITRLELDDDELDAEGFDWLLWGLRFLFLAAMIAVAIWGHADLLANSPATRGDAPECDSQDADLAQVCSWIVIIEACSAALCTGIILAQAVSSLCDW